MLQCEARDQTKQGRTENLHVFLGSKVGKGFDLIRSVLKRSFQLQCGNMNRASLGPIRIYGLWLVLIVVQMDWDENKEMETSRVNGTL